MTIREFQKEDKEQVEEIFRMYFNDTEFLGKLSEKLEMCLNNTDEYREKQYRFFVAEENGEIVGIAVFRKATDYMKQYATTDNPVEFYVLASKYKRRGIGEALRKKRMEEAKKLGFTEAVFYSPDSHKDSWGFHDRLGFERVGPTVAPDGEPGMAWRKVL